MTVSFEHRLPSVKELAALAESVCWSNHSYATSIGAPIAGSAFGVVAVKNGAAVGMAHVVSDGVHNFYVQDTIVHPAHSDRGVGSQIVGLLTG